MQSYMSSNLALERDTQLDKLLAEIADNLRNAIDNNPVFLRRVLRLFQSIR